MSQPKPYRQLEVCWVHLEPTRGSKTQKNRPCVIIQADMVNPGSRTVLVAPLLPGHKPWPFVVNLSPSKGNGLDKERHLNLKQLRVVDISRIGKQQGTLEKDYLPSIDQVLKLVFGMT